MTNNMSVIPHGDRIARRAKPSFETTPFGEAARLKSIRKTKGFVVADGSRPFLSSQKSKHIDLRAGCLFASNSFGEAARLVNGNQIAPYERQLARKTVREAIYSLRGRRSWCPPGEVFV